MLCGWEGNHIVWRRTGHASQTSDLSTYGLTATEREMSTPLRSNLGGMVHFTLLFTNFYKLTYRN